MVLPDSHEISGVPCYLGTLTTSGFIRLREFHPLRYVIPNASTSSTIDHLPTRQQPGHAGPTTPLPQRLSALTRQRFSLLRFRSPLLTESLLFSLPTGTEMFHFPAFPPTALYIQAEVAGHDSGHFEVSPFGHPRITARLPTPLGLSQVTTSFISSWCQGIHRSHLVACQNLQRCSRPL